MDGNASINIFNKEEELEGSRTYLCIDLKSYYASVECIARGLNPLEARLLVADPTRSDNTICLAVSPALKAIGVPGRPRLFEAKQAIRRAEIECGHEIEYIIAPPRMAEYVRISSEIYSIYMKFVSTEDIHVYSIDECFMDITHYLHMYKEAAIRHKVSASREMAMTIIKAVLSETGIVSTAGIGTNMYLAKVGMDIVAKKSKADEDGVRIAELNETSYKYLLWNHKPLTDFWQIGRGKARRLAKIGAYTMGDIARISIHEEEYLYKAFGVDAEILIDHAWGKEPCTMSDIKSYKPAAHSLSTGQVLPRAYAHGEGRNIFIEMADKLSMDMVRKKLRASHFSFWINFDGQSLESGEYNGPVVVDFYGRLMPKSVSGNVRLRIATNSTAEIIGSLKKAFDRLIDPALYIRRITIAANDIKGVDEDEQIDIFSLDSCDTDDSKECELQEVMLAIREKYGSNALIKGMNLEEGSTYIERNNQIGGHRA